MALTLLLIWVRNFTVCYSVFLEYICIQSWVNISEQIVLVLFARRYVNMQDTASIQYQYMVRKWVGHCLPIRLQLYLQVWEYEVSAHHRCRKIDSVRLSAYSSNLFMC